MDWAEQWDAALRQYLPDLQVLNEEPMSRHTTFRIGGAVRRMACPKRREELAVLLQLAAERGIRTLVIGRGSDLLVADGVLDLLAVDTTGLAGAEVQQGTVLNADCGITLERGWRSLPPRRG